jgi:Ca2+/Na+ antiporter
MDILNVAGLGLIGNIVMFVTASVVVWIGGVRLARGADALADKAGFGHAYIGIFLLGVMVSLPELTFRGQLPGSGVSTDRRTLSIMLPV